MMKYVRKNAYAMCIKYSNFTDDVFYFRFGMMTTFYSLKVVPYRDDPDDGEGQGGDGTSEAHRQTAPRGVATSQ